MDNVENSEGRLKDIMEVAMSSAELKGSSIRNQGCGGYLTVIGSPNDVSHEAKIVDTLISATGIERTDVEVINIEQLLNAFEIGIDRSNLEIPENHSEKQSIVENVFEYVYRGFGNNKLGWRLGTSSAIDSLRSMLERSEKSKYPLEGTPFGDFLAELDLDLGESEETGSAPRMRILYFPPIIDAIEKRSDVVLREISPRLSERANRLLNIFRSIGQVYPGRFQADNPDKNVIVAIIDNSYRAFVTPIENDKGDIRFELCDAIETPEAYYQQESIAWSDS